LSPSFHWGCEKLAALKERAQKVDTLGYGTEIKENGT